MEPSGVMGGQVGQRQSKRQRQRQRQKDNGKDKDKDKDKKTKLCSDDARVGQESICGTKGCKAENRENFQLMTHNILSYLLSR